MYLSADSIIEKFKNKGIIIYGAGRDAQDLIIILYKRVRVLGAIETIKRKDSIMGVPVCSVDEMIYRGLPIIIASRKYYREMSGTLVDRNLTPGKDFYVWDREFMFVTDASIKELIRWNKNTWHKSGNDSNKKRVLIPIQNGHDVDKVFFAYAGNYFSEKFNAEIDCYKRKGSETIWPSVEAIYRSFGVSQILEECLTEQQEQTAQDLCNEIWNEIISFEDWKEITVWDVPLGNTIIRDYLRFEQPVFNPKEISLKKFLLQSLKSFIFWYDRMHSMKYRFVLLNDGAHWEGYIREIAIKMKIPVYAASYRHSMRLCSNYPTEGTYYKYYKHFWNQLTDEEKKYGIQWARKRIEERFSGQSDGTRDIFIDANPYSNQNDVKTKVLDNNKKIKILIAIHILDEDCYGFGKQIFDDNYISWLIHLGELSNKHPEYDWYIKKHPHGGRRDDLMISQYVRRYPNIKLIPTMCSAIQLSREGLNFVLTVHGTVGFEYPMLGIQAVTAGNSRYEAFSFSWNPDTKDEYDWIISNLANINNLNKKDEILQFYAMEYLYYNHKARFGPPFFAEFENKEIGMWDEDFRLLGSDKRVGAWKYSLFLNEIDNEKHSELKGRIKRIFDEIENWDEKHFYKNVINITERS